MQARPMAAAASIALVAIAAALLTVTGSAHAQEADLYQVHHEGVSAIGMKKLASD